jgi:hypothetical protein
MGIAEGGRDGEGGGGEDEEEGRGEVVIEEEAGSGGKEIGGHLALSGWGMGHEAWRLARGARCMGHGAWGMGHGPCRMADVTYHVRQGHAEVVDAMGWNALAILLHVWIPSAGGAPGDPRFPSAHVPHTSMDHGWFHHRRSPSSNVHRPSSIVHRPVAPGRLPVAHGPWDMGHVPSALGHPSFVAPLA